MKSALLLLSLAAVPFAAAHARPGDPSIDFAGAAAADTVPSVRWTAQVPRLWNEAGALRRAAREAGDSAAMRAFRPLPNQFRVYVLMNMAQHQAAAAAAREGGRASEAAAVTAASAAVLAELFPDSATDAAIAREAARELGAASSDAKVAAGERLGRQAAARVLERARTDNTDARWTGTVPTGEGMWRSAPGAAPAGAAITAWRPWALDSASQFRPAPPPAYGSAAFTAALGEVRRVARERTPEQAEIALRWHRVSGLEAWNRIALDVLARNNVPDARAAQVLALMNVASYDATIACWDAKFHYWYPRPNQADTTLAIVPGMAVPNHPSYPSAHGCGTGASAEVLGHFLPAERAEIDRLAAEVGMSRLYGGLHYRFDNDAGLELGRRVARHVIERDRQGRLYAWTP